ncbi:amino acid ABC transporter permease [Paracoccus sp. CPCC 101403]|uniref:Amino acid ABC transporter permease n=2 Tax=Paracoccus broussonetiae TaxID=3075834 RepID=A0ABU3E9Z9_9RHOB|nr:amino acid ABC transporter permease [Paracoccus sp. CPCC 101403]MDT1061037.1 amino acid ABC transporter permease [Paracoccus sp. CPCC 101403]
MNALDFSVILERWPELLRGTLSTLGLALAGMALAMVIGIAGVTIRRSGNRFGSAVVVGFVELIRNTPFLVQIFFIFFALPLAGIRLNPTVTAIVALGLNGGAYAIEIIRGGVESIPKGQTEAGLALGLHPGEVFRTIVLKPALRAIYPSLCSQFILLTLTTSICTSISAFELTQVAQRIDGDTFRSFEVYFTVTAIYLLLSWVIMALLAFIGSRAFAYPTR